MLRSAAEKRWMMAAVLMTAVAACTQATRAAEPTALSTGWTLSDAKEVTDDGAAISKVGYAAAWKKAVVPGTVLTSLVADGLYPEPLYGENNRPDKIPESLARAAWWYRTEFAAPAFTPDANHHVWLNLAGINYEAEVWINGHDAGRIRGAFVRGRFDITPWIKPAEKAAVAVQIFPPPHPGDPAEQTVALGTGRNGGILAEDGPTFIASIGWDWMPAIRDRNVGIWRDVTVESTGPVTLADPLVTSKLPLPRTDAADLTVSCTLSNAGDTPQHGALEGQIENIRFTKQVDLAPHEQKLVTFTPDEIKELHVSNPRLWWPNTYGAPNLYDLHLRFTVNGALSDEKAIHFGIREITYEVPDSDNLTIVCNGVPIICKGGDWGMDEAMKRIPRDRLEAQIRMHQQANYTMIRNWVGQSTEEDFYDLCDRHGILIWDELFQPNPSDGPNPLDVTLYLANVREKVLRYRSHPSIALWCGRNEGNPPENLDPGIAAIFHDLDPTRRYQRNSNDGKGVRSGGPYSWRFPKQYYQFNAAEAFKTEIGSVSIPTLQAVQHMMPEKDWWPVANDDWAEHDLLRGAQNGDSYPRTLAARYGEQSSLEDFVREAQLANYEAYRAMYEGRFVQMFHPVTGVITWMSNPAQPSMVWQLYSHDLEPNASLFGTQKACEPLHVMLNQVNDHVEVIDALPQPRPGLRLRSRVINLDGTIALDEVRNVNAHELAATDAGPLEIPAAASPVHFIKLELLDGAGKPLSENFYWRTTRIIQPPAPATATAPGRGGGRGRAGPPQPVEDFTDLQKLAPAQVQVSLTPSPAAPHTQWTATLTNRSNIVALATHVQLCKPPSPGAAPDADPRILPVYYSDNYISLLPGETRQITIDAPSLNGRSAMPVLHVDGWNVR